MLHPILILGIFINPAPGLNLVFKDIWYAKINLSHKYTLECSIK